MVFILDIWASRFVAKCRKTGRFLGCCFSVGFIEFYRFSYISIPFSFRKAVKPPPKRPKLCLVRVLTRLCLRLFYGFRSGFLALFLEAKQATKN